MAPPDILNHQHLCAANKITWIQFGHIIFSFQCVQVRGKGFIVGAYQCECIDGYYFPDLSSVTKAYPGSDIEATFRNMNFIEPDMFRCTACAAGCDTCVDNSPCLYEKNQALVIVLILLVVITLVGFLVIAVATYLMRHEAVCISPITRRQNFRQVQIETNCRRHFKVHLK